MTKAASFEASQATGAPDEVAALVDREHFKKVCGYLDKGRASPTVALGGEGKDGYVQPTIFDQVKPGDTLARDEIFGPVLSVITVASAEEAVAAANDTQYGLAAAVFSGNGKRALRAARAIRAGTVTVNCYGEGDVSTPFGGYKQSGFGGRDKSIHAHDQYTELKTIWVDLSDRAPEEAVG